MEEGGEQLAQDEVSLNGEEHGQVSEGSSCSSSSSSSSSSSPTSSSSSSVKSASKIDKKSSHSMLDDNVIHLDQNDLNYGEEDEDFQEECCKPSQSKVTNEPVNRQSLDDILLDKITAISSSEESDDEDQANGKSQSTAPNQLVEECSQLISDEGEIDQQLNPLPNTAKSKPKKEKKPLEDGELEDGELSDSDSDESEIAVIKGSTGLSPVQAPAPPALPQLPMSFDCSRPPPILFPVQPRSIFMPVKASERSPDVGVCKFYLRGACTWGEGCKFFHPAENDKQYWIQKLHIQRPNNNYSFAGSRIIQTTNLCKPPAVIYSVPNFTAANPVETKAVNTAEDAWERGLRQARELVNKKAGAVGSKCRASEDSLRSDRSPMERRDSMSPPLASPSSFQTHPSRRSVTAHSTDSDERGRAGRKTITGPSSGRCRIPSLIDSIRSPDASTSHAPLLGELSQAKRHRQLGPQVIYPHKESRYVKRSGRTRSRSQSSASEEDEQTSRNSRKLKSLVSPVFSNPTQKRQNHRPILVGKSNEFSDPWARDRRARSKSRSSHSGSQSRTALTNRIKTMTARPRRSRDTCSPVSSSTGSTVTFPSDNEGKDKKKGKDKPSKSRKRRGSSSASKISSSSSASRSPSHDPSKQSAQKRRHSSQKSVSPREKRARKSFGSNTLRSLLKDSESACRTGDLAAFKIPKKKQEKSVNSSDDDVKATKPKKLDVNKFFESNEEDAPAAYRSSKPSSSSQPASKSQTSRRNKRRRSSSSSSCTGSSSSFGTSSMRSKRKKDTKVGESHKQVVRQPSPEADPISSDEDEEFGGDKNGISVVRQEQKTERIDAENTDFRLKKKKRSSSEDSSSPCHPSENHLRTAKTSFPQQNNHVDTPKISKNNLEEDDEIDAALESVCTNKEKSSPGPETKKKFNRKDYNNEAKKDEENQKRYRKQELIRQLKQVDEALAKKTKKKSIAQA